LHDRNIQVTTLDIDESVEPDIVGSVTKMPVEDARYDLVLCSQVLEHIPFDEFSVALREIHRASKKYVVLSLPHWGYSFGFFLKVPLLKQFEFLWKLSGIKSHYFDGEHYWEIGKRGYPLSRIKDEIERAGFIIKKDYIRPMSPFHHFFVLEKR
jgi:ubiquinone/menaquinone biosynthesis C-methylase UbiE